jgi:hypothetical protein
MPQARERGRLARGRAWHGVPGRDWMLGGIVNFRRSPPRHALLGRVIISAVELAWPLLVTPQELNQS